MIFRRTGSKGECDCCGTGSALDPCDPLCDEGAARSLSYGVFPGPISPGCFYVTGNSVYDLAGGASGTAPGNIGVSITGASDFRQLAASWSADMGDAGEWIVVDQSRGPITIDFTPPAGKRICYVQFGVTNREFGTNTSWAASMTDTGGTTSISSQSVVNAAYSGSCALANSALIAQAAPGEGITQVTVSFTSGDDVNPPAIPYIGIGAIAICLVDA